MPSARSATALPRVRSRTPRRGSRQRTATRRPVARVRWDRVGRVALLVMLGIVGVLYIQHAVAYLSARSQFDTQGAAVRRLEHDNAQLVAQAKRLRDPATIVLHARELGMVKPGERPYVITGLTAR